MNINRIFFEGEKLRVLELFIRTSILYFTLFASTKLMKFFQSSIVTPYNFLMAAITSNIAASRMINPKSRLIDAILIITLYSLIHLIISYLYLKAPSVVTQKPIILIKNGKIIKENLSNSKLTIDNLFSILREKNAYDIENVEYLIAESIGNFSIAINNNNLPPTKSDIGIETSKDILSEVIIYKGKIDEKVLSKNGLNCKWIEKQLKLINIDNINNIYLGVLTSDKKLYINL
ncbi:YetF domain-containing protein [Tissierella sp.]|uniref:DUF421 domain-containing protein n=1 Tax=Tissierella sp. TaxID=41274 RepID=UPI0028A6CB7D|nr:YetF domain-containing protein [Tissierella sp.]